MAGHVVATLAASWFVFFALLAARGVMQCVFGQRLLRRLAAAVQLVTTLGLVVVLLMLPFIASSTAALKRSADGAGRPGAADVVHGDLPEHRRTGRRGLALARRARLDGARGGCRDVAIGASVVAYRRVLGTTLEAVQAGAGGRSWVIGLANAVGLVVARHPVERGFFSFTVLTLLRSPWHRVVLAVFFGGALALSMVALDLATVAQDGVQPACRCSPSHALAMQFVVLVIVLAGVRVAASAPAELRANWVLRMLESGRPQAMDGGVPEGRVRRPRRARSWR